MELFFHVCFAILFGVLRTQLLETQDYEWFAQSFLAVWSMLAFAADYATRFNDDDIPHKIFWSGYGFGLIGARMHALGETNERTFGAYVGLTLCLIGVMYLRVAAFLPECRRFASFFGCGLVIVAGLWALCPTRRWLWVPALAHHWLTLLFVGVMPRSDDVPMSIDYHTSKFAGIMTMSMGQMCVAVGLNPEAVAPSALRDSYVSAGLCFLLLLDFKLLIFDADYVAQANHAIRRSRRAALAWLLLSQPLLCFFANLVAADMSQVQFALSLGRDACESDGRAMAFGTRMLCGSSGSLLLVALLTSRLHRTGKAHQTSQRLVRTKHWQRRVLFAFGVGQLLVARAGWLPARPLCVLAALVLCGLVPVLLYMHDKAYLVNYLRHQEMSPLHSPLGSPLPAPLPSP